MKTVIVALSVAILGSGAGNAQSPAFDAAPSANVSYSDVDLTTADGPKILRQRVMRAVNELCRDVTGPSPIFYAQAGCRRFVWQSARIQIEQATTRAQAMALKGVRNTDADTIKLAGQ